MKISIIVLALGLGGVVLAAPLLDPKLVNATAHVVARSTRLVHKTSIDLIADVIDTSNRDINKKRYNLLDGPMLVYPGYFNWALKPVETTKETSQANINNETSLQLMQISARNYHPDDEEVKEEVKKQNKFLDDVVRNACKDTKDEKEYKRCLMKELERDYASNKTAQTYRRDKFNEQKQPTWNELKLALGEEVYDQEKLKGYAQSIQDCSWNNETQMCYQTVIFTFTTTAFQTAMAKLGVSPEATRQYALAHSADFDEMKAAATKMASLCGQDPLTTPDCIKKLPKDFASAFLDSALRKRNSTEWRHMTGFDSDGWPFWILFKHIFQIELRNQDRLTKYYDAIADCPWGHKTAQCYEDAITTLAMDAYAMATFRFEAQKDLDDYATLHKDEIEGWKNLARDLAGECGRHKHSTPQCIKGLPEAFAAKFLY